MLQLSLLLVVSVFKKKKIKSYREHYLSKKIRDFKILTQMHTWKDPIILFYAEKKVNTFINKCTELLQMNNSKSSIKD